VLVSEVDALLEGFHRRAGIPKGYARELKLCVDGRDFVFSRADRSKNPDTAFEQVIRNYMKKSRALIVFWGPHARFHTWINLEIKWWSEERADGPVYFALTHGEDPYADFLNMPAALYDRGGGDIPTHFDLRGFYRKWTLPIRSLLFGLVGKTAHFSQAEKVRWSWIPERLESDNWKKVRSFDLEVSRLAAQLVSNAMGQDISAADLGKAYADGERRAKVRRRATITVWSLAALLLTGTIWDASNRRQHAIELTNEAQKAIDDKEFERAMRISLLGIPMLLKAPLATLGWPDPGVRKLLAKLAGAAQLSSLVAQLKEKEVLEGENAKPINTVTFNLDASKIVAASQAGRASLWKREGEIFRQTATCSEDDAVPADARKAGRIKPNVRWVRDSKFSRDGNRIVSVGFYGHAWVWKPDASDCKHDRPLLFSGHTEDARTGSFNPDGTLIVTTSDDDRVVICDVLSTRCDSENGTPFGAIPLPRSDRVTTYTTSAEFGPDGKRIAISRSDGLVAIAEGNNFKDVSVLQKSGHSAVWSARFSKDGRRLVTASEDGYAIIWDLNSKLQLYLPRQNRSVNSASFSPDDRFVVTASSDGTARIWDATTLTQLFVFKGHTGVVKAAEFRPDGKQIITGSDDGTVRLWDAITNIVPPTAQHSTVDEILNGAMAADGKHLVTTAGLSGVAVWSLSTDGSVKLLHKLSEGGGSLMSASFGTSSEDLVMASVEGKERVVAVRNTTTWKYEILERKELTAGAKWVSTAFSSSKGLVAIASDEDDPRKENAKVLRIQDNKNWPLRGSNRIRSIEFDRNGDRIAAASEERKAGIWNTSTGKEIVSLVGHASPVLTAHFSLDGTQIVTASLDGTARVWDASNGNELHEFLGHESDVNSARFSDDGARIVTASGDRTVRIWDKQTGEEMIRFELNSAVNDAIFTHDGGRIIAMTDDGSIETFDVAWTSKLDNELAKKVCAEKLKGIEKLTSQDAQNPILSQFRDANPCDGWE
jgi:WD40 repeat protein